MKIPLALLKPLEEAAVKLGITRHQAIREAILLWLKTEAPELLEDEHQD